MADAFSALRARDEASVMRTYGRYPLADSRAQGSRLFDLDGREYVDLLAGIAVCNLGHCHPEVTEAIRRQAGELVHVSNLFYQREQVELAERLLAHPGVKALRLSTCKPDVYPDTQAVGVEIVRIKTE